MGLHDAAFCFSAPKTRNVSSSKEQIANRMLDYLDSLNASRLQGKVERIDSSNTITEIIEREPLLFQSQSQSQTGSHSSNNVSPRTVIVKSI